VERVGQWMWIMVEWEWWMMEWWWRIGIIESAGVLCLRRNVELEVYDPGYSNGIASDSTVYTVRTGITFEGKGSEQQSHRHSHHHRIHHQYQQYHENDHHQIRFDPFHVKVPNHVDVKSHADIVL
jgi:hypothetical protein